MDNKIVEINKILNLTDKMIEYIETNSIIRPGNNEYMLYKRSVSDFCKRYNVKARYPALYDLLDFYYYESSPYFVDFAEAQNIRKIVVELKKTLCTNSYEQIFISHREKDKKKWEHLWNCYTLLGFHVPLLHKEKALFFARHIRKDIYRTENEIWTRLGIK